MGLHVEARRDGDGGRSAQSDEMDADWMRKELDDARARIASLEERLAHHARERSELVHLVCHELRTPITVISGFGRLLQNEAHGELNKAQAHYVAQSLQACRRLDQFVVDLLEARPESGTPLSVEIAPANLHELIRARLESLAPVLDEREVRIELELGARAFRFPFDERRIEQVITNLLSNALRYGRPGGTIRITTRTIASGDSVAIEVSVEDDGPGIPEEDREHVFAPYVRGGEADCEAGLGIGLAICRRIIAAHDGSIHVESGALGGARFVFELPLSRAGSEAAGESES
jgi:signal transduction histidine kinase